MQTIKGRAARGKDAQNRLLDAALELFCRDGYDGVTTRALAERAGVNEVTLFRIFGTKERMLFALFDREADVLPRIPPGALEPTGDVKADLERFGSFMIANMLQKAPIMKLAMTETVRRPAMWRSISPAPKTAIRLLSGYFEQAAGKGLIRKVDPRLAAVVFFSFFFRSMVMSAFLGRDMLMRVDQKAIRDFCSMFVEGLEKG